MISRSTLFTAPGGDTIQIESTAKYLRKLNCHVDIKLSDTDIHYSQYDIIHFFNIIRPADILIHIKKIKNIPFVVSTVFVDYEEFERKGRGWLFRQCFKFISSDTLEYIKAIARWIINNEKIKSSYFIFNGQRNSIKHILKSCTCILPNSNSEFSRLSKKYEIQPNSSTIPNSIDSEIFNISSDVSDEFSNSVICVARIEGLKNQLNLIRALNPTNVKLFIIGKPSPNNMEYYNICKSEANENIVFIDHISQEELSKIYHSAKVHAMPSWFETTGLSSLEAAYCDCNVVITRKGDQEEYFKDFAYYCEPDNIESIRNAVLKALKAPYNKKLKQLIIKNYTWDNTAQKTLEAYKKVLNVK